MRRLACVLLLTLTIGVVTRSSEAPPELTAEQQSRLEAAENLNLAVVRLSSQGNLREAVVSARKALAIRRDILGEKHLLTATSLYNLSSVLQVMGAYAEARPYVEQALAIHKDVLGVKHPDTAKSLDNLGRLLQAVGDYHASRQYLEQALAIHREVLGDKHPHTAVSLNNMASLLCAMGDYAVARPYYEQALAIQKEVLGETHSDTVTSLNNLGEVLLTLGDYAAARPCLEKTLKIRKDVLGDKHPHTAGSLNNLGMLLKAMGDYPLARQHLEHALAIHEEVLGEEHPYTATSLDNLGLLLQAMGDYTAAGSYYERALGIRKRAFGDTASETAKSLNNLGFLRQAMGDYAGARSYFEQALAIEKETLGEKHPATAIPLDNLGMMFREMGDHKAALPYLETAVAIMRETLGQKHVKTAGSLNNLGVLFHDMGNYAMARPCFEEALAINREVLGKEHPRTAQSLNSLGNLLEALGDYATARSLHEEALVICKEVFGEKHPETARLLDNLGGTLSQMGDHAAARPYYEQALSIRKELLGEKHPHTADSFNNLSALEAATAHWEKAAVNVDHARRIFRRHAARVLHSLSAREQMEFLETSDKGQLYAALSLGLHRAADSQLTRMSVGWLLNGKAVTQEVLAQRTLAGRLSADPEIQASTRELLALRRQLATLTLSVPKPGQEAAFRERLEDTERREERLARRIAEDSGEVFQADPWVEVAVVRQVLPADAMLIDIARFKVFNFQAKDQEERWQPAHYAAWIIPAATSQQTLKIIDLGEADKIDRVVQNVRTELQAAIGKSGTIAEQGEPEAEKLQQESLKRLAKLVLEPIVTQVGNAKKFILSPDAALWLVPREALPLEDGRYAIEQYQIRYVVSGRDLVTERTAKPATNRPVIMANPDYDLSPSATEAATRAVLGESEPTDDQLRSFEPIASSSALPRFARLPYTAAEAQLIAPTLEAYTDETPIVYTDHLALEGIFKAFRNQKVVVLSTHGYFLEDQKAKKDDRMLASTETRGIALTVDGQPIENPLLRCGLLLAGCNRSSEARAAGAEDGILTGMEIVGTDFRGTELVVLSACETGLGQIRNGEGVAGLRQAFQLAGAQTVVATLWQIPDRESARMMTTFFENLAAGQTKPDALRNAQLAMIQYRREKHGAAHPFFWAAFTITGE